MSNQKTHDILNGIMGLCIADALGVPVEFKARETLTHDPVVDMRSYGTYNQPAGTWSDDTSMTLGLLDSLANGLDYEDIMQNFSKWYYNNAYTPHGTVFDIGNTSSQSIQRFKDGIAPIECGGTSEHDNGNGSLMRILPLLFHLQSTYGEKFPEVDEAYEIIHNTSALTHAHKRSQIACGIYLSIASKLSSGEDIETAVKKGIETARTYYHTHDSFSDDLAHYERLFKDDFAKTSVDAIRSSGYVVDTLEAAIWCLLTTDSYKECVLKAVNLGHDTDTVAAVVGGLAGLYYGYAHIPEEWLEQIAKKDYVEELCDKLHTSISKH